MNEEILVAHKNEEKLKFISNDIKRYMGDMQTQCDKNRKELSLIYNFIRDLIMEREQALKKQISDNLQKEERECKMKLQENNEFLEKILELKKEQLLLQGESDLEILSKARERVHLTQECNGTKSSQLVNFTIQQLNSHHQSLIEVKKEQELTMISKLINPQYKNSFP